MDQDNDVLSRLVQAHEAYDQSTADARSESERDRDYYDGYQWTDEERKALEDRKQPCITVNRIKPKVDFLKGQEQQRRQMPRAFPRTPKEEDGASAATDSIRYVMDQSKWDRERSGCFDNHIIEGACAADVQVYEKADGEVCIDVRQIPWDRMWGDGHSRQRDWSDAKIKGQYLWMDLEDAVERWPDKRNDLEGAITREGSKIGQTYNDVPRTRWADPKRRRVRIVEAWSKEEGKVWHTHFTEGVILEREESPYVNEDGEPDDGFVFGSCFIDRDGNRYGVVRAWISIQDEINKRRSKALHLNSVRQTFGNQLMGDKNKIRNELAKPDGHIEVQAGAKFGEDFGILPTGDMAAAQVDLLQEAKSEIDAVGVNAALSGTEERVMSGRALMAKSEQGLAELQPVFDGFAQFQHDVYRKVWNRIRQFWTEEKWIRVTDDERNVKFVGLNQPLTMGEQILEEMQQQGQEITPEMQQQARMDPRMQVVVGVKNEVAKLDVDIVLDEVPASATLQNEAYQQLLEIAPQAATMPPPLFEALIEASPLRNKEKVLAKLKGEGQENQIPPEIQQAMAQHEQMIEQLQQELQKAQAEALQAKASAPQMELAMREEKMAHEQQLFEANKRAALLEIKVAQLAAGMTAMKARTDAHMASKDMQMQGIKTMHATEKMHDASAQMHEASEGMRQEREQASEKS
jgi:hypothetical protein